MLGLLIAFAVIAVVGCTRRNGMNFQCAWPSEPMIAVDLSDPRAWRHVLDDIRVAEELAIRYGDRASGRRLVSVLGVLVRLGAGTDLALARHRRGECSSALFQVIADTHTVTTADIARVRARLADGGANLPVSIPSAVLYAWLSLHAIRWIQGRFGADERGPTILAVLIASVAVSGGVMLVVQLWAGVVEMVRVGNEHLSYRAGRGSWPTRPEVLPIGVLIFWLLAATQLWTRTDAVE